MRAEFYVVLVAITIQRPEPGLRLIMTGEANRNIINCIKKTFATLWLWEGRQSKMEYRTCSPGRRNYVMSLLRGADGANRLIGGAAQGIPKVYFKKCNAVFEDTNNKYYRSSQLSQFSRNATGYTWNQYLKKHTKRIYGGSESKPSRKHLSGIMGHLRHIKHKILLSRTHP